MNVQLRRCIGSNRFGIEVHDAPVSDFPAQPSQKDGLGRMCKVHWRQYTNGLRKAALERKAAEGDAPQKAPRSAKSTKTAPKAHAAKATAGKSRRPAKAVAAEPDATPVGEG